MPCPVLYPGACWICHRLTVPAFPVRRPSAFLWQQVPPAALMAEHQKKPKLTVTANVVTDTQYITCSSWCEGGLSTGIHGSSASCWIRSQSPSTSYKQNALHVHTSYIVYLYLISHSSTATHVRCTGMQVRKTKELGDKANTYMYSLCCIWGCLGSPCTTQDIDLPPLKSEKCWFPQHSHQHAQAVAGEYACSYPIVSTLWVLPHGLSQPLCPDVGICSHERNSCQLYLAMCDKRIRDDPAFVRHNKRDSCGEKHAYSAFQNTSDAAFISPSFVLCWITKSSFWLVHASTNNTKSPHPFLKP